MGSGISRMLNGAVCRRHGCTLVRRDIKSLRRRIQNGAEYYESDNRTYQVR